MIPDAIECFYLREIGIDRLESLTQALGVVVDRLTARSRNRCSTTPISARIFNFEGGCYANPILKSDRQASLFDNSI
jgi:hypothetical protein